MENEVEKNGRKTFQVLDDAIRIYKELKEKYPNCDTIHLDNILNALCFSLCLLINQHVDKEDRNNFIQLIFKIITKNKDWYE